MKYLIILVVIFNLTNADRFVLPAGYDNLVAAKKSKTSVKIYNGGTAVWSDSKYTIGGKSLKFRCAYATKIVCIPSGSQLLANIAEKSLRVSSSSNTVPEYDTRLKVEDKGSYYKICVAAYGGITVDEATLTTKKINDDESEVVLNYIPNSTAKSKFYYYLTDAPSDIRGGTSSYIRINHEQVCR